MPKKFQGENTKSSVARARKAEVKAAADTRKKQEQEDAFWKDDDKHVLKKEQRKDDKEKKRLEALERKKENQRLLEEESVRLKGRQGSAVTSTTGRKVTQAQIEETLHKEQEKTSLPEKGGKANSYLDGPLEENVNRIIPEEGSVEARTIEDAIAVLRWNMAKTASLSLSLSLSLSPSLPSTAEELDRHPERRMKAAFAAFEEVNMPRIKQENPNMRLSQLKQLLKKEWMKSPENPMNQRHAEFNAPK
ncbi:Coiled-coil domain-containing protein 124 [Acipenser ruthenus]|uniref:Coiled-coil domain-containing protein 124 n=1 Tax=Acipenser ruthenus TaxID=7906 RepID=A0A662YPI3_ACIRT|nr:Coiled-coil domain-containing protein 124 [Acipenser ruthenus]